MTADNQDSSIKSPIFRVGIGQDSHRFLPEGASKLCVIGGLIFEECIGLDADSDGDVVFHAICNAITSVTGVPILGKIAIDLCKIDNITDSRIYLEKAVETLGSQKVQHIALTIEGQKPRMQSRIDEMRQSVASVMGLTIDQVGITCTSGDGLSDFGCGKGLQCFCSLTTVEHPA